MRQSLGLQRWDRDQGKLGDVTVALAAGHAIILIWLQIQIDRPIFTSLAPPSGHTEYNNCLLCNPGNRPCIIIGSKSQKKKTNLIV